MLAPDQDSDINVCLSVLFSSVYEASPNMFAARAKQTQKYISSFPHVRAHMNMKAVNNAACASGRAVCIAARKL